MSMLLNTINHESIDLSVSELFTEYYYNNSSFTKHIIEKEINNGHYSEPLFLKIFKNNDAVVIDGGANIGLFSLFLYKACKKIFAVEPTAKHLNVLRDLAVKLNINNIEFCEVAFNNYAGKCMFMVDEGNTTQNRISNYGMQVDCLPIIDFIRNCDVPQIDLLKIDIEGGEKFAILDDPTFKDVVDVCKHIYIEIHPPFVNPVDIVNRFSELGYRIKFMNSMYLNNNLNVLAYR